MDTSSADYAHIVATNMADLLGPHLVGTYLHGSAALGGFLASRSDIDLLVVTSTALDQRAKRQVRQRLAPSALPCPAAGLELSVITRDTTLRPTRTPAFQLHLTTSRDTIRVVDGQGHPGDADLLLHFAVCRHHAIALLDSAPRAEVFAAVPRAWLLTGLLGELDWALRQSSLEYRVLNTCRAWRFAAEGALCSKLDGGRWARDRWYDPGVIDAALALQRGQQGALPDPTKAAALVQHAVRELHVAQAGPERP